MKRLFISLALLGMTVVHGRAQTGANSCYDVINGAGIYHPCYELIQGLDGSKLTTAQAALKTPPPGFLMLYANVDNTWHQLTSAGVDTAIGGGGGGTIPNTSNFLLGGPSNTAADSGVAPTGVGIAGLFAGSCASPPCVLGSEGNLLVVSSLATGVLGSGNLTTTPALTSVLGSNGQGTNIAGANLVVSAGLGTGNAFSGDILFQTAPVGSSSTTLETPVSYMILKGTSGVTGNLELHSNQLLFYPTASLRGRVGPPNWDSSFMVVQNASISESQAHAGFSQDSNGTTALNAATGQVVNISINNVTKLQITAAGNVVVTAMPTSCSGLGTGTLVNLTGIVNICP